MAITSVSPTPSPEIQPIDIHWDKDSNWRGVISEQVRHTLHDRGCLEVPNLPPCNLSNAIHPIFKHWRFADLTKDEYKFIRPALRLATSFITEDEYL